MKRNTIKIQLFDGIWGILYDTLADGIHVDKITFIRENLEYDTLMITKHLLRKTLQKDSLQ